MAACRPVTLHSKKKIQVVKKGGQDFQEQGERRWARKAGNTVKDQHKHASGHPTTRRQTVRTCPPLIRNDEVVKKAKGSTLVKAGWTGKHGGTNSSALTDQRKRNKWIVKPNIQPEGAEQNQPNGLQAGSRPTTVQEAIARAGQKKKGCSCRRKRCPQNL